MSHKDLYTCDLCAGCFADKFPILASLSNLRPESDNGAKALIASKG